MSTKFEVITFTASQECYAEALLKLIDPDKKFIKHRYYRDSCVPVFGNYVKVRHWISLAKAIGVVEKQNEEPRLILYDVCCSFSGFEDLKSRFVKGSDH